MPEALEKFKGFRKPSEQACCDGKTGWNAFGRWITSEQVIAVYQYISASLNESVQEHPLNGTSRLCRSSDWKVETTCRGGYPYNIEVTLTSRYIQQNWYGNPDLDQTDVTKMLWGGSLEIEHSFLWKDRLLHCLRIYELEREGIEYPKPLVLMGSYPDVVAYLQEEKQRHERNNYDNEYETEERAYLFELEADSCESIGWEFAQEGFFGTVCRLVTSNRDVYKSEFFQLPNIALRRDAAANTCADGRDPFTARTIGQGLTSCTKLRSQNKAHLDPEAEWEWKKDDYPPQVGDKIIDAFVGTKVGSFNDQQLEPPEDYASAKLIEVKFQFCGCLPGELVCADAQGNLCCIDCCQLGQDVIDLIQAATNTPGDSLK